MSVGHFINNTPPGVFFDIIWGGQMEDFQVTEHQEGVRIETPVLNSKTSELKARPLN